MKIDPIHRRAIEDFVRSGALEAVVAAMQLDCFADFTATREGEAQKRETLYAKVNALEDFRATLTNYISPQAEQQRMKF